VCSSDLSCRCPAVQQPGVWRIAPIGIPYRCEMGRTIIGAVWIVLESEGGAFAADASVQEPPKALVVELREIGHRILSRSNCGALCGADAGCNALLDAVSALERRGRCRGRQAVRRDDHGCRQAGCVGVIVKFPPALILPPAVVHPL